MKTEVFDECGISNAEYRQRIEELKRLLTQVALHPIQGTHVLQIALNTELAQKVDKRYHEHVLCNAGSKEGEREVQSPGPSARSCYHKGWRNTC